MRITDGRFIVCEHCGADWVQPLPEGWTMTYVGNYGIGGYVTTHLETCPDRFISLVPADEDEDVS